MTGKSQWLVCVLALLLSAQFCRSPIAAADPAGSGCGSEAGSSLVGLHGPGFVGASGACSVLPTDIPGDGGSPVLVIDCGYATASDDHTFWNKACGPTGFPCPAVPGTANPHQFMTVFALTEPPVPIAAWCAGATNPMPSAAALRDEVIRLLRPPAIGVSPDTGTGLVNFKTLFWISTASQLQLGQAKLVGFPVELRVNYLRTEFDFGDQATATLSPGPGQPYDPAHDCGRCADRFGHTYTAPGRLTITAHVYWQAQFRVGNHPWTTIPGEVTSTQPSTTALTVRQARSTLVSPTSP